MDGYTRELLSEKVSAVDGRWKSRRSEVAVREKVSLVRS